MRPSALPVLGSFLVAALVLVAGPITAQRGGMFLGSANDPAIAYSTAPLQNAVVDVNRKLQDGTVQLKFEGRSGFLQSALDALEIAVDSQVLVFSRTSLQAKRISQANPRALFFNDGVALGWVRDGEVIEVAAHDARQGIVFYELDQKPAEAGQAPQFRRDFKCLGCHMAGDTLGVPGLLGFSTVTPPGGGFARSVMMDHRMPLDARYGGWFVTGSSGTGTHHGNEATAFAGAPPRDLRSVEGLFDPDGFRAMSSDIAANLVLSHQVHMMNLMTRIGWEARAADPKLHPPYVAAPGEEERIAQMMSAIATEFVDYLLFVDEAPLPDRVRGSTAFAERFSGLGPRDKRGRSLHQLDLTQRLLKYPCSYLIYSPAFDALPPEAKDPIYRRMWAILSGSERATRYQQALPLDTRRAIVEILRDTKSDLPDYFSLVVSR
jgi:hypothetical protein